MNAHLKSAQHFVDDLVGEYGTRTKYGTDLQLGDIPEDQILKLASHLMRFDDNFDCLHHVTMDEMVSFTRSYDTDKTIDFGDLVKNSIKKYYWETMEQMLADRINDYEIGRLNDKHFEDAA